MSTDSSTNVEELDEALSITSSEEDLTSAIEDAAEVDRIAARNFRLRIAAVIATLVAWIVAGRIWRGQGTDTLAIGDSTDFQKLLNESKPFVESLRGNSVWFYIFFEVPRMVIDFASGVFQELIAQPADMLNRPLPIIGWLGIIAIMAFLGWLAGGWRISLIAFGGLMFITLQGLWTEAMDTLAMTLSAVVIALMVGIPIGVAAGLRPTFARYITPVLDLMQTMPTLVYLAPLTLFFLIGNASAVIATLIYALPPVIRITAVGVNSVSESTLEAATSMGSTRWQRLRGVTLPLAARTIVLGINQTIMAALAMVTLAALIDAPGLGKRVIYAMQLLDVGAAFNAGLAIVVLAVMLDRMTTAAGNRRVRLRLETPEQETRRVRLGWVMGGLTLVTVAQSYLYLWAAQTPELLDGLWRKGIVDGTTGLVDWITDNFGWLTLGTKDFISYQVLNPLEGLLVESPMVVTAAALIALGAIAASWRGAIIVATGLGAIYFLGVWADSMRTLATVLLATVMTMIIGVLAGIWMGRNDAADRAIRPILDAGQTMPSFVYLVPFLALFQPSRFTAIAAAVVFAAPVATKIMADGIRGVSKVTVEAATAMGSTTGQIVRKVQLPMAVDSLMLATNQGLIYVLSMVAVGGLVGAGALGYLVVAGFTRSQQFGKGLAAGAAIVILGIVLDRVMVAAVKRRSRA